MAAPTLSAQGALTANGFAGGATTATLPTHAAGDILIATFLSHNDGTATTDATCTTPGWAVLDRYQITSGSTILDDVSIWWKRATSAAEANPSFAFESGWNTGNSTVRSARAYVISGCVTTGDPWDDHQVVGHVGAADGALDAVTVSGSERLVVHFCANNDTDTPTATGWTAGTGVSSGTGSDSSAQTLRKDDVSASTSADATSMVDPGGGKPYVYFGISFKPTGGGGTTGTSATTLIRHTAAGSGTATAPGTSGSGSPTLARHTASGEGSTGATGTSATTLVRHAAAGAGSSGTSGSGSPTLVRHTATGSGTCTAPGGSGSGSATLARWSAAGSGSTTAPGVSGSGAPSLVRVTASGSGVCTAPGVSGSGSASLSRFAAAGAGVTSFSKTYVGGSVVEAAYVGSSPVSALYAGSTRVL